MSIMNEYIHGGKTLIHREGQLNLRAGGNNLGMSGGIYTGGKGRLVNQLARGWLYGSVIERGSCGWKIGAR